MKAGRGLSYIALGGGLMLIGMAAPSIFMPNLVAQRDISGKIECTRLKVVSSNGDATINLCGMLGQNQISANIPSFYDICQFVLNCQPSDAKFADTHVVTAYVLERDVVRYRCIG